jgi:hypothetical protein
MVYSEMLLALARLHHTFECKPCRAEALAKAEPLDRLEMDAVESLELTRVRRLPDSCRTQRWEGSRPRPAAAGLFPKPSVFVDRVIGIRL